MWAKILQRRSGLFESYDKNRGIIFIVEEEENSETTVKP
jgi:hypothetical protein